MKKYFLLIDPGHVLETPGKRWQADAEPEFREYEFNWDVARRLERRCRTAKIPYHFSLPVPSLKNGHRWPVEIAARRRNWEKAQLKYRKLTPFLLSIHADAYEPEPEKAEGLTVFYNETPKFAAQLAYMLSADTGLRNRGARENPGFSVLDHWDDRKGVGLLVENGFFTNTEDRTKLLQPAFREQVAETYINFFTLINS